MKTKILLLILAFSNLLTLLAESTPQRVVSRGIVLLATNLDNSTKLITISTNAVVHWLVLSDFSIERRDMDSPRKLTLSGKIKDRNAWFPAEQIPLFFGSDLQSPRLAAITDSHGNFSFNVTLKEDNRDGYLQCSAITNGDIYIGSANVFMSDSFDEKRYLKSGLVRKYLLADLLKLSNNTNNAAGIR
jgi:hypothetical protein